MREKKAKMFFRIRGYVDKTEQEFDERVAAFSEAQAKFLVHRRVPGYLIYTSVESTVAAQRGTRKESKA